MKDNLGEIVLVLLGQIKYIYLGSLEVRAPVLLKVMYVLSCMLQQSCQGKLVAIFPFSRTILNGTVKVRGEVHLS